MKLTGVCGMSTNSDLVDHLFLFSHYDQHLFFREDLLKNICDADITYVNSKLKMTKYRALRDTLTNGFLICNY